jgi:predicted nucleotide-binding protein
MTKATKVNKVFISHGHDEVAKLRLKDFIRERLGMEPVILAEQPDLGLTVVEKLEKYGPECDFALIILTADDQTASGGARARQNVTHELGFFHGVLGRDRVLLLKQAGVELFSNISGLIYKEFERDSIASVFEDIRIALESCSAQSGGLTVPKKEKTVDMSQVVTESLDILGHDWPRMSETVSSKECNR